MTEPTEPIWLSQSYVEAFHEDQLHKNGGLAGLRAPEALKAIIARPVNLFHYENADLQALAACYAHGIVKSHPFLDGNKRTAFTAAAAFLDMNGVEITMSEPQATVVMLDLTCSKISQEQFEALLRSHSRQMEQIPTIEQTHETGHIKTQSSSANRYAWKGRRRPRRLP